MDTLVVALVVVCFVLICWCFSLILRLVSDIIARKHKRLQAEYQRTHLRNALIAILISFVGSVISGWYTIELYGRYGDLVHDGHLVLAASLCLTVIAALLGIWTFIGDRSRGRLRCPRCWYNMSGLEAVRCPECGHSIQSPNHLCKTRRVKWPIVPIALFLSIAIHGFISARHVDKSNYFALVPSWLLMMGWEHLPEDWISRDSMISGSSLFDRLGDGYGQNQWIADRRVRAFGIKLSNGMLTDTSKRWNPRRLVLIEQTNHLLTHRRVDGGENQWIGPPIDANELLRLSTQDVIAAYQAEYPSQEQLRIRSIEISKGRYGFYFDSPYGIAKDWIVNDLTDATPYAPDEVFADSDYYHRHDEYWDQILDQLDKSTQNTLTEFHEEILSPAIQNLLKAGSPTDSENAISLMLDAGLSVGDADP